MVSSVTHIRVKYADTDQMGQVYHGRFTEYLEVGRTDLVRKMGLPYKSVEENGILMPVAELRMKYRWPAFYDELLAVHTRVETWPTAIFHFLYEIRNESDKLLVEAEVKLAFIDKETRKVCRAPDFILDALKTGWQSGA
ncbi:MAG: thioesterase family protein [Bacteroidota bacterium]